MTFGPIQRYDSLRERADPMALFAEPAKAAGRWRGLRLRAESRPW